MSDDTKRPNVIPFPPIHPKYTRKEIVLTKDDNGRNIAKLALNPPFLETATVKRIQESMKRIRKLMNTLTEKENTDDNQV